jgi:hypothetical protein
MSWSYFITERAASNPLFIGKIMSEIGDYPFKVSMEDFRATFLTGTGMFSFAVGRESAYRTAWLCAVSDYQRRLLYRIQKCR